MTISVLRLDHLFEIFPTRHSLRQSFLLLFLLRILFLQSPASPFPGAMCTAVHIWWPIFAMVSLMQSLLLRGSHGYQASLGIS
jgi:hypothetical protein